MFMKDQDLRWCSAGDDVCSSEANGTPAKTDFCNFHRSFSDSGNHFRSSRRILEVCFLDFFFLKFLSLCKAIDEFMSLNQTKDEQQLIEGEWQMIWSSQVLILLYIKYQKKKKKRGYLSHFTKIKQFP